MVAAFFCFSFHCVSCGQPDRGGWRQARIYAGVVVRVVPLMLLPFLLMPL